MLVNQTEQWLNRVTVDSVNALFAVLLYFYEVAGTERLHAMRYGRLLNPQLFANLTDVFRPFLP